MIIELQHSSMTHAYIDCFSSGCWEFFNYLLSACFFFHRTRVAALVKHWNYCCSSFHGLRGCYHKVNKHASAAVSDILQCSNLEFTDICNIDLQIKTPHPWVRFTHNHIVTTVEPPLTLTSLQWPLLFVPADKKSIYWLLLKPLYNGLLFDFTINDHFLLSPSWP